MMLSMRQSLVFNVLICILLTVHGSSKQNDATKMEMYDVNRDGEDGSWRADSEEFNPAPQYIPTKFLKPDSYANSAILDNVGPSESSRTKYFYGNDENLKNYLRRIPHPPAKKWNVHPRPVPSFIGK
ncbi:hypothetical protein HELRODRAFT_177875 [Helobdella robusta]|uniref:Uncharacterized protein n=1 Tax=Helobdella robusta TaxID=6412 RepID=T1FCE6_HELRO|nr:hypothetical protein HELRODRAFT_177875 [Helobdella robusta]ESN97810.1 hypothetical protein HELRODRAFT_177875 [Helobdella robusta]